MNDEPLPELALVRSTGGATFVVRALRSAEPGRPVAVILPAMGTPTASICRSPAPCTGRGSRW